MLKNEAFACEADCTKQSNGKSLHAVFVVRSPPKIAHRRELQQNKFKVGNTRTITSARFHRKLKMAESDDILFEDDFLHRSDDEDDGIESSMMKPRVSFYQQATVRYIPFLTPEEKQAAFYSFDEITQFRSDAENRQQHLRQQYLEVMNQELTSSGQHDDKCSACIRALMTLAKYMYLN